MGINVLDVDQEHKGQYLEALGLIERLHRRILDLIKIELDRVGREDVNSVQALLLYNIGDKELTAGELRTRGYYLGSNVSYNLKKMVEAGYIDHQRSTRDRRAVRIRLTPAGHEIRALVDQLYDRQVFALSRGAELDIAALGDLNDTLKRLERFWHEKLRIR
jgi:DNA-binding MarR family transcriptional regulator